MLITSMTPPALAAYPAESAPDPDLSRVVIRTGHPLTGNGRQLTRFSSPQMGNCLVCGESNEANCACKRCGSQVDRRFAVAAQGDDDLNRDLEDAGGDWDQ